MLVISAQIMTLENLHYLTLSNNNSAVLNNFVPVKIADSMEWSV